MTVTRFRRSGFLQAAFVLAVVGLAGSSARAQALGSFSNSNGGGSGSNDVYNAELWIGTNCTAPTVSGAPVTGSDCFEAGSILVSPANIGVSDVINAGNNTNFAALAGFFTTTPGAGYMANVSMGNGGRATEGTVPLSSTFGSGNPPFPGDVVTSFVYTLTSIPIETSGFVLFSYTFEVDGGAATPEPASIALFGAGIGAVAFFGLRRRRRA